MTEQALSVRIKIDLGGDARLGPGKMDLLQAIADTGSISAAGRSLGMSYRRAWLLIDALNQTFEEPSVRAAAGGAHGGGTVLTPFGANLLAAYRSVEAATAAQARQAFAPFRLRPPDAETSAESA